MAAQQKNFHTVDAIPTKSLPNTTVHWLFVILGVTAVALGLVGFVVRRRGVGVIIAGLGVVVIATTLIISIPTKTRAADKMTAAFGPIFNARSVRQGEGYLSTLTAMDRQLTTQALPGLATLIHVTPQQLNTALATDFPSVAVGLEQLPAILNRIASLVTAVSQNLDNFRLSDAIPTKSLPTTDVEGQLVIPAVVLIAAGAAASVSSRRRRPLPTTGTPSRAAVASDA